MLIGGGVHTSTKELTPTTLSRAFGGSEAPEGTGVVPLGKELPEGHGVSRSAYLFTGTFFVSFEPLTAINARAQL